MADGVAREELPRIAVASIQDWKRVKSNIDRAAKSVLSAVIEQQNLGASDANAVQTYFERVSLLNCIGLAPVADRGALWLLVSSKRLPPSSSEYTCQWSQF